MSKPKPSTKAPATRRHTPKTGKEGGSRLRARTEGKAKNKGGRPTKYDIAMCDRVIALGKEGKSMHQIARDLGISLETLYNWREKKPEFSEAITRARQLAQAWWEDQGQEGIWAGSTFNSQAYALQMRNRFPDDYRERTENTHKLDASDAFVQLWQAIGAGSGAKLIEGSAE